MDFQEGQEVKYKGTVTTIDIIYDDGTCRIANPEWDWDMEAEHVAAGTDYDVPYWIRVKMTELR